VEVLERWLGLPAIGYCLRVRRIAGRRRGRRWVEAPRRRRRGTNVLEKRLDLLPASPATAENLARRRSPEGEASGGAMRRSDECGGETRGRRWRKDG
jgi:hypothetical protein